MQRRGAPRRLAPLKYRFPFFLCGLLALLIAPPASGGTVALASDQIRVENALPGSRGWLAPEPPQHEVEGYASEVSALPGDVVHLHVSTQPAARYRVVLYRLGWYGGAGARVVACAPRCDGDVAGTARPVPAPAPDTGAVRASWPVTDTVTVPSDAPSGYYAAQLLLTSGPNRGGAYLVPLVVRAPAAVDAPILVQVPVNTWQAYNPWGGKSLYNFQSTGNRPAVAVSFDRPYSVGVTHAQQLSDWELPLVRFLEREGYGVAYQTDVDTDRSPESLLAHRLVVTAGHGEYWTKRQRDAFDAARDARVNLAFLGANTGYWQVRYADGGRTVIGYKSLADPIADPAEKTALFRELTPMRRECDLMGVQHQGGLVNWDVGDYTVEPGAAGDRWLVGTGLEAGSRLAYTASVEVDTIPGSEARPWSCGHMLKVLFHRELGGETLGNADAVRYRARSGSTVFAAGSLQLIWALDDFHRTPRPFVAPVDPRVQQFFRNMLGELTAPAPQRRLGQPRHRPHRRHR